MRTEAHALVEMTTQEEAACAIQQLNGMTLQGTLEAKGGLKRLKVDKTRLKMAQDKF